MAQTFTALINTMESDRATRLRNSVFFHGRFSRRAYSAVASPKPLNDAEIENDIRELLYLGMYREPNAGYDRTRRDQLVVYQPIEDAFEAIINESAETEFQARLTDYLDSITATLVDKSGFVRWAPFAPEEAMDAASCDSDSDLLMEGHRLSLEKGDLERSARYLLAARSGLVQYGSAESWKDAAKVVLERLTSVECRASRKSPNLVGHTLSLFAELFELYRNLGPHHEATLPAEEFKNYLDTVPDDLAKAVPSIMCRVISLVIGLALYDVNVCEPWRRETDSGTHPQADEFWLLHAIQYLINIIVEVNTLSAESKSDYAAALVAACQIEERCQVENVEHSTTAESNQLKALDTTNNRVPARRAISEWCEHMRSDFSTAKAHNMNALLSYRSGHHREALDHLDKAKAALDRAFQGHDFNPIKAQWEGGMLVNRAFVKMDTEEWADSKASLAVGIQGLVDANARSWQGVAATVRIAIKLYQYLPSMVSETPPWEYVTPTESDHYEALIMDWKGDTGQLVVDSGYKETQALAFAVVGESHTLLRQFEDAKEMLLKASSLIKEQQLWHHERNFRVHWLLLEIEMQQAIPDQERCKDLQDNCERFIRRRLTGGDTDTTAFNIKRFKLALARYRVLKVGSPARV